MTQACSKRLRLINFICLNLLLSSAASTRLRRASELDFDIEELSEDYHQTGNIVELHGHRDNFINVSVAEPMSENNTVLYIIRKPIKIRESESKFHKTDAFVLLDTQRSRLHFRNIKAYHRGFYTVYRLEYSPNGTLLLKQHRDFEFFVDGLKRETNPCLNDAECDSGDCVSGKCVCTADKPAFVPLQGCYEAKKLKEACIYNEQCREDLGPSSECYQNKCRCEEGALGVMVGPKHYYCAKPAQYHKSCILSKQCSIVSERRYCSPSYKCECLPDYRMDAHRHCYDPNSPHQKSSTSAQSFAMVLLSTMFVTFTLQLF